MIKVQIAEDLPSIRQQYVNDLQVYPDISVIAATDTMQIKGSVLIGRKKKKRQRKSGSMK